MNGDPEVVRYLGFPPMTREQSDTSLAKICGHWNEHGFGPWFPERLDSDEPIGFVGLYIPDFLPRGLPAVEVGWRLAPRHWGNGFATGGASAALEQGFTSLGLDRIISITVHDNVRSQAVMGRLGLSWLGAEVHPERGLILQVRGISRDDWMVRQPLS